MTDLVAQRLAASRAESRMTSNSPSTWDADQLRESPVPEHQPGWGIGQLAHRPGQAESEYWRPPLLQAGEGSPIRGVARKPWIIMGWVLWLLIALLALGLVVSALPPRYDSLLANYQSLLGYSGASSGGTPAHLMAGFVLVLSLIVIASHFLSASFILWRRPRDPMALLLGVALVANGSLVPVAYLYGNLAAPPAWQTAVHVVIYAGLLTSVATLYLFPNGTFVPRWGRWLLILWALLSLPAVFWPQTVLSFTQWPLIVQATLALCWVGAGLYAQVHRYRTAATGDEQPSSDRLRSPVAGRLQRQQIKWGALGLLVAALTPTLYFLPLASWPTLDLSGLPNQLVNRIGPALFTVPALIEVLGLAAVSIVLLLFPLSLAIAILRYRLWDIDLVINRTLVYGALTGLILLLYALAVGVFGALLRSQDSLVVAILATGLVAVLFQPLHRRLQRNVNRLMYGDRDDPATVLSRLGQRLEGTIATDAVLPVIVQTVAQALRLPYTAILLSEPDGLRVQAEYREHQGFEPGTTELLPLSYQGELVGQLIVTPRSPGEAFSSADRRLLTDLARQAGQAVYGVRLTADLQRSRQRLVATREEERRRLRRDLHDGLGPQLASISLKVDAARNLVTRDPEQASQLLDEFKDQARAAIADIRRLVYDLRPPALDQLGLVGALRAQAASASGETGRENRALTVEVVAPDDGWPEFAASTLPAAVEVAAYRIATEALTNVVKHARARHCTISLSLDGALHVVIEDDGIGIPESSGPTLWAASSATPWSGVGLSTMRERAEELGGSLRVAARPGGGTVVSAVLPLSLVSGKTT